MRCFTILLLVSCLAFCSARHAAKRLLEPALFDSSDDDDNDSDDSYDKQSKRHHVPGHDDSSHDDDDDDDDVDSQAKRHHVPGHDDSSHDDDDDDDSQSNLEEQCQQLLLPCFVELSPYLSADNTAEVLRNRTLRVQCQAAISIRNCFRTAIESQACSSKFSEDDADVLRFLSMMAGIIKFVCEDRLDEFETHEQCLRDTKFDESVEECRHENFDRTKCEPNKFITCTDKAIDATPTCGNGAKQLVEDFIREILSYVPQCKVPGMRLFNKLRMKLLM